MKHYQVSARCLSRERDSDVHAHTHKHKTEIGAQVGNGQINAWLTVCTILGDNGAESGGRAVGELANTTASRLTWQVSYACFRDAGILANQDSAAPCGSWLTALENFAPPSWSVRPRLSSRD